MNLDVKNLDVSHSDAGGRTMSTAPQPGLAPGFLLSGGRVASKYGHEHRKVRAQYQRLIDAGQGWCAEPICLMPSREIPPGSGPDDWHVCHDPSGTQIIGPGHARCNESEAAKRGNAMRKPTTDVTTLTW